MLEICSTCNGAGMRYKTVQYTHPILKTLQTKQELGRCDDCNGSGHT